MPIARAQVEHLFQLSTEDLVAQGIRRVKVDAKPGYPCRLSLTDAEIGEEVLLLPYQHHQTSSPYQSSGPIYVRDVAEVQLGINEIPAMLHHRHLSLRAYSKDGEMLAATVGWGAELSASLQECFHVPAVAYIHIHNAGPGCYNCQAVRVVQ